jgi:hypothetical protein
MQGAKRAKAAKQRASQEVKPSVEFRTTEAVKITF